MTMVGHYVRSKFVALESASSARHVYHVRAIEAARRLAQQNYVASSAAKTLGGDIGRL